ncbi:hypothetical protein O6H91_05G050000 [Diphasiastrum complanatum]|uniref:Uncharacterized protein n=1 Tax=Diphasiastrum complanatum TaxID=34168 RepID=A0ACC2DN22_DIPCM|nr:hypothetical protein O6H91_05G050000 [Diphasiastrum complanatum]
MTGESELVHKDAKHPFLMAGCKVADGYGTMLITCVGTDTEWGQIMASISDDTGEETPLQVRLNGVATFIGQIGLTVAIIVFIMLFVRYFAQHFKRGSTKALTALRNVVDILSIAVTIVVVAVPEGLPLAVTLTLAYSMRKMMADKSLVRHLAACETMGSATTICSDKTGTLTLNEMTVVKAWVAGDQRKLEDTRNIKDSALSFIMDGIAHNCNASVYFPKDGGDAEVTGSPTERALLSWGLKVGLDFDVVRTKSTILHVETFNSTKKRAGVAIKVETGEVFVHWKGAAEIVLDLSEKWLDADGSEVMLTDEKILEITNTIDGMAAASLRCVALAYRCLDAHEVPFDDEQREAWRLPDTGLVFSAVVGIKDPCRPGVPEAVAICQAAGVKVRMVTGDNLMTAKAIAQECGILTAGGVVVEGKEFRNYSEEERIVKLPNIDVLARSSPSDKLLLVKTLRGMNEVVAVTGDGTNDAAALHEADIGLSMGISGTEVAKESSDIIILDDNFASVVKVVRWGRSVYANIQKFIQFQLTVNIVALVINFVAAAKSEDVPLTTVQLLWVNLLMDTLGALALATEPPTDELMKRNPVGRRQPLITNVMWRNIWGQAIYQLVILLTIYFRGDDVLRLKSDSQNRHMQKNTMVFNSFVFCQLFNEINSRKPEDFNVFGGIFHNSLFCGVLLVTSTLQVIFVVFLKKFFKTTALSWKQWLICICIGAISLPVGFLVKLIPVREKPFLSTSLKRRRRGQRSSRHRPSSRSTLKLEQSSGLSCES